MMCPAPFTIGDRLLVDAFRMLGQGKRYLRKFDVSVDADGMPWASLETPIGCLGFSLEENWYFDNFSREHNSGRAESRLQQIRQINADLHRSELSSVLDAMRLGGQSERLACAIHRGIVSGRNSLRVFSDVALGGVVWGTCRARWPRHWRTELLLSLRTLARLHFAPEFDHAAFGRDTALLTRVGDLRASPTDVCPPECESHGDARHHHVLVNVGRGFLGVLESCANPDEGNGRRTYSFPFVSRSQDASSLRTLGQTGRLTNIYAPSVIGDPTVCSLLTVGQRRLLQAVIRETTRKAKTERRELGEAEVFTGNRLPLLTNRKTSACDLLTATDSYVGFNGNGKRKRLGYRLDTPGGWLAKAGYPAGNVTAFLADLRRLSELLELVVVGFLPSSGRWYSLAEIENLRHSPASRVTLERLHVRIFAAAGYVERWNTFFGWPNSSEVTAAPRNETTKNELLRYSHRRGFKSELAVALNVDRSLLSKVFKGLRPWPSAWLDRAQTWLDGNRGSSTSSTTSVNSTPVVLSTVRNFSDVARSYLSRGMSVVPQIPNEKRPPIKWKPFQDRLPTYEEIDNWASRWPEAGLALVLGPTSNIFVIDVDGPEAHQALIAHLGSEPSAPKSLSGSRRPDRYHLFFKHPAIITKAKSTPWHPKLEFRGKGGIVIVPPSIHRSGQTYAWAVGQSLDDVRLPDLPTSILSALTSRTVPILGQEPATALTGIEVSPRTREFLSGHHADALGWNGRLFTAACDLHGRHVPRDVAERLLLGGARPWNESEREAALRTIDSAFREPREPARA